MAFYAKNRFAPASSSARNSESNDSSSSEMNEPFCEVSEETYRDRLGVSDAYSKASAGYSVTPAPGDGPAQYDHRTAARRLDAKVAAKRKAQEELEASLAEVVDDVPAIEDDPETDLTEVAPSDFPAIADDVDEFDIMQNACDDNVPEVTTLIVPCRQTDGGEGDPVEAYLEACIEVDDTVEQVMSDLDVGVERPVLEEFLAKLHKSKAYEDDVKSHILARQAAEEEAKRMIQRLLSRPLASIVPPFVQNESAIVRAFAPPGYRIAPDGVYLNGTEKKPEVRLVMKPVCIDALVRSVVSSNWSARVRAINIDGKLISALVPFSDFSGKGGWCADLRSHGVPILDEAGLSRFANLSLENPDLVQMQGVTQMGFAATRRTDGTMALCFVLPEQTYYADGDQGAEEVVMLPQGLSAIHAAYRSSGTLDEWKAMVESVRGNPLHIFALCMAFATPMLTFCGVENGGVHIYFKTSNGKTIVLQLAATPFGNGARPNIGGASTLVQTWHGTTNAIKVQTAACSGTLAIFDEVGVSRGPVSPYSQTGGQGKGRAKADGSLQEGRSWSTQILSSGEVSMAQHIESKTGRPMMGGEGARIADIPSNGLLGRATVQEADALKANCGLFYGTAGPAFVQWVLNRFNGSADALSQQLTAEVDAVRDDLCSEVRSTGHALQNLHERVMRRFALQAVAGCWAVQAGILPFSEEEVMGAVREVRDAWLDGQSSVSIGAKGIQKVRDFVLARRSQMLAIAGPRERVFVPGMDAGILHDGSVLLTQATFVDVCGDLDAELVATALDAAGILVRKDDQRKAQVSIAKLGVYKQRFYVLDLVRLFGQSDTPESADDDSIDLPDDDDPIADI